MKEMWEETEIDRKPHKDGRREPEDAPLLALKLEEGTQVKDCRECSLGSWQRQGSRPSLECAEGHSPVAAWVSAH